MVVVVLHIAVSQLIPGHIVVKTDLINQVQSDIVTNANRYAAEWVANGKIDEQWDEYMNTLKGIGLEDMTKAMQAAYDRFLEAK